MKIFEAALPIFILLPTAYAGESICLVHEMRHGLVVNDVQKPFAKDAPWQFSTTDGFFAARVIYQDLPGAKGVGLTIKGGASEASAFFEAPFQQRPIVLLRVDGRDGYVRCNLQD